MKKKKLSKKVIDELVSLLTAKSELEKEIVNASRSRLNAEKNFNEVIHKYDQALHDLSVVSNDLEKKYGKASEFNIETGEINPSGVFDLNE